MLHREHPFIVKVFATVCSLMLHGGHAYSGRRCKTFYERKLRPRVVFFAPAVGEVAGEKKSARCYEYWAVRARVRSAES